MPQDSKDSTVWLLCVDCKRKLYLAASLAFYTRLERLLGCTGRQQGFDPSCAQLTPFHDSAIQWRFCAKTHLLAHCSLFLQHLLWKIHFWLMPCGYIAQWLSQPPSTICAGHSACVHYTSYSSHTQMPSNQFRWQWHVLFFLESICEQIVRQTLMTSTFPRSLWLCSSCSVILY